MNRKLTIFSIISLAILLSVMTSCTQMFGYFIASIMGGEPGFTADLYILNKTDDTLDILVSYKDYLINDTLYGFRPEVKEDFIGFQVPNPVLDSLLADYDTIKVYHNGQLLKVWSRTDTIAPEEHHFFNPASWIIEKDCDLELCATFEILPEDISKK